VPSSQGQSSEQRYPVVHKSGHYYITILNEGHCWLLFGLVIAILLMIFYVFDLVFSSRKLDCGDTAHIAILFGLLAIIMCLRTVLWNLWHIHTVLLIEEDIHMLHTKLGEMIEDRVRHTPFCSPDHGLVDFWVQHTIPWLELLQDLHDRIRRRYGDRNLELNHNVPCLICDMCDAIEGLAKRLERRPHERFPQWVRDLTAEPDDDKLLKKLLEEDGSFRRPLELAPLSPGSSSGSPPPSPVGSPKAKSRQRRTPRSQSFGAGRMNFSQQASGGHLMGTGRERNLQRSQSSGPRPS